MMMMMIVIYWSRIQWIPIHVHRPGRALLVQHRFLYVVKVVLVDVDCIVLEDKVLHRL